MPLLDSILSVIAPHNCLGCGHEGTLLCKQCITDVPVPTITTCYLCRAQAGPGMICKLCRANSPLTAIRARTTYGGIPKQLIHKLKFERAVAAAKPMAQAMAEMLPYDIQRVLIVPIPTATSRVRARGYDQAAVLARLVAKKCRLPYSSLLVRSTQARQVGASREERRQQLKNAFHVRRKPQCEGSTIILVDDVFTTGSSLEAAARVLRAAGALRVFGLVFAYHAPKSSENYVDTRRA